ncbi:cytochrome P450 [Tricharina praecox]|uniref:cytochrome P450 n=1 Tax=Tricharina praecox TaxID=43433 RepID=UPI00222044CF|nr:cytochrome P450 [Tricharina praecox]KAI5856521.1 cytochrome P450 [Tricharina praecox]
MISLLESFTSNLQYRQSATIFAACTLAVLCNWFYRFSSRGKQREYVYVNLPSGPDGYKKGQARYLSHSSTMIQEGIQKLGEAAVFWVPTMLGPTMVAPRRYLPEIKNHPDLSFANYIRDGFAGAQTGIDLPFRSENIMRVIKRNINQSLGHVTAALSEEAVISMDIELPLTDEWIAYKLHPTLQQIVARVSSRVFLGETLCRNQRWLDIIINYTTTVMTAGLELREMGQFFARIAKWWLPSYKLLDKSVSDANTMLMDLLKTRREQEKAQGDAYVKPNDALQWAVDQGEPDANMARFQLFLGFAAVHTTSITMTHLVYDLCTYSEYVDMLREELYEVLGNGEFNVKSDVQKLKKMDSFMKESQRLHPIQDAAMQRTAARDIELSDGLKIYAGDRLQVASRSVLRDPSIYSDPETFDGLRFLKMRQEPGQENGHQFVTSSETFFAFGHGTHVCPGRFFAGNQIKIILSHLLMRYDFKFPDGQTQRPKSVHFEEAVNPNPDQEILFKRRRY